jgi:ComF family protein
VPSLIARALDLALPPTCVGCEREGVPICDGCLADLSDDLERPPGVDLGLPAVLPEPLLQLEWCAPYRGLIRDAIHALKYGGERRVAEPLGIAVARRWRRAGIGGDLLVPVPVHPERRRERGFDQAELLARAAARELGLPVGSVLERRRATTAQSELDRDRRAANVEGVFGVRRGGGVAVAGRWPILVDDVATTGATLAGCARALLAAGALAVSAITVGRER